MTTLVPNTEFARLASDEDIATVVTALTAKGMAASVVENRAEARSRVLDLLPEGAEVYTALSQTLEVLGLREEISTSSRYVPLRPQIDKLGREGRTSRAGRTLMASPEYVIGSVHAITHQGQVLIASGSGSQLAGYAFGASYIIWVVGAQKSCGTWTKGCAGSGNIVIPWRTSGCMPSMGLAASQRRFSWLRGKCQAASRFCW